MSLQHFHRRGESALRRRAERTINRIGAIERHISTNPDCRRRRRQLQDLRAYLVRLAQRAEREGYDEYALLWYVQARP